MTVNETLAQASNAMVYGAITAFTVSMVAFSISLAKGRRLEATDLAGHYFVGLSYNFSRTLCWPMATWKHV